MTHPLLPIATEYHALGYSILPTHRKDNKEPDTARLGGAWKHLQYQAIPPIETFTDSTKAFGIITGVVSGNLECLDIDTKHADAALADETVRQFFDLVESTLPGLLNRIFVERTQSGGWHLWYRCTQPVGGPMKLACLPGSYQAFFETKGEGGYALITPSPGYTAVRGGVESIPVLTGEERNVLLECARSFHAPPEESLDAPIENRRRAANDPDDYLRGVTPLDDFDLRGDTLEVLERHGWKVTYKRIDSEDPENTIYHLRRPGKNEGHSATYGLGRHGVRYFYCFTSSAPPFEAGRKYRPSQVLALLDHAGDFSDAARSLAQQGFGRRIQAGDKYKGVEPAQVLRYVREMQTGLSTLAHILLDGRESAEKWIPARVIYSQDDERWFWYGRMSAIRDFDPDSPANRWHMDKDRRGNIVRGIVEDELVNAIKVALVHYRAIVDDQTAKFNAALDTANNSNPLERATDLDSTNKAKQIIESANEAIKALTARLRDIRDKDSYMSGILNRYRWRNTIDGLQWDANPHLFAVENGVIDLRRADAFRPQKRDDYILTVAPVIYDHEARCPRFAAFVSEVLGEDASSQHEPVLTAWLKRFLGYSLSGENVHAVHPILWGPEGRNGKDTLINALQAVFGPYMAKVDKSVLLAARRVSGTASPELYQLRGKRLVYINETDEHDVLNVAQIKELTGSESITCRPLYGGMVTFPNTAKVALVSNHKPGASGDDQALWARLALLPFLQVYLSPEDSNYRKDNPNHHVVDTHLVETLKAEKSGILNWLLDGYSDYRHRGLARPDAVVRATQEYRSEQDSVQVWIDERCELSPLNSARSIDLYSNYVEFCKVYGLAAATVHRWAKSIQKKGFVRERSNGTIYRGLGLRDAISGRMAWSN